MDPLGLRPSGHLYLEIPLPLGSPKTFFKAFGVLWGHLNFPVRLNFYARGGGSAYISPVQEVHLPENILSRSAEEFPGPPSGKNLIFLVRQINVLVPVEMQSLCLSCHDLSKFAMAGNLEQYLVEKV
eukprot:1158082-Pelagomonas_calceolata.AAC.1